MKTTKSEKAKDLKKFPAVELMNELRRRGCYVGELLSDHTEEEMFEGQIPQE